MTFIFFILVFTPASTNAELFTINISSEKYDNKVEFLLYCAGRAFKINYFTASREKYAKQ